MNSRPITPIGVLVRGLIAGAIGSAVQSQFFHLTSSITPGHPKDAFKPPEVAQSSEMATATVARRFVEHFMQRGPLTKKQLENGGILVHFAFGAGWGALYAVLSESVPFLRTMRGAAFYGATVWMISDNVILPVFRLAGWPHKYSVKNHSYALLAHMPYSYAVWASYELLGGRGRVAIQGLIDRAKDQLRARASEFPSSEGIAA